MTKKFFVLIFLVCFSKFFTQRNDRFVFHSSPSFHDGFTLELLEGDILRFTTKNNYYILNSLNPKKPDFPESYYNDDNLSNNSQLLSNSSFEAILDPEVKNSLIEKFKKLADLAKNTDEKKFGYDGITFSVDLYDGKPVKIWSPDKTSVEGHIIMELFDYLKLLYKPNSIVDQYIFESRFYVDKENVFEIINYDPLVVKFYDLSFAFFSCGKLESKINDLPNSKIIYIDFSQVKNELNDDVKKCFVNGINKKFKQIKLIQTEERG